ncbi:carbohydrate binding domain-containing protein [Anaerobaca lacustris]|uniref:Carbohydrate binding domain-containing protein n=1 Tax=Anaerobaca lacustris TaxID=3044600 RepID=A0AAW6U855_9BACT|nr:carbohydrate binding domain-containing protein [Sedimentisphaerales bacterium M17dextr]
MYKNLICSVVLAAWGLSAVTPLAQAQQVENLVLNHSFEVDEVIQDDGAYQGWWTWNPAEGAGSMVTVDDIEFIDGARSIRVDPVGTENWHFIVAYSTLALDMSKDYTVSFWAKAQSPRPLTVALKAADNSVDAWGTTTFNLTTEWAEYTYTSDVLHTGVKLEIWCAASNAPLWLDFVHVYEGPYVAGIEPSGATTPVKSADPNPATGATDVPRDTVLSWTAGAFAATHDVYFGISFDDVNDASRANPSGVLLSQGQTTANYDPAGVLDFNQTYYWRVDEVNAAPDNTIFKGDVWSFTTEPFAYTIPSGIVATSNGTSDAASGPDKTVDSSGIDPSDLHSIAPTDMWLADPPVDEALWIQYDLGKTYKLHEMLVWNYNSQFELILGFGLKDVTVEYSKNGTDWTALAQVEFTQATAKATYTANTMVDLQGVPARYVRLTVHSGWGATGQFGLSEVRFRYIPAQAREPQPADGAIDVEAGAALAWRSGRDAALHEVYLGADPDALALAGTVDSPRFAPDGIEFGSTYFWQIVEVNETEAVTAWPGDVWTFSTQEYALIDGFETYNDDIDAKTTIFDTWIDGWVNDTGSTVGYLNAPFAERTIVHSGRQSMPLQYDNTAAPFYSEAERTFDTAQDWTVGGADSLRLYFRGDAANSPQTLYVTLKDSAGRTATVRGMDPDAILVTEWQPWQIALSEFGGVSLTTIKKMTICVGNRAAPAAGGTGIVYIDDIGYGRPAAME